MYASARRSRRAAAPRARLQLPAAAADAIAARRAARVAAARTRAELRGDPPLPARRRHPADRLEGDRRAPARRTAASTPRSASAPCCWWSISGSRCSSAACKNMKSVTAAEAAALAAWRVLAQKDRVGALVFNDCDIAEIRPQRSRSRGDAHPARRASSRTMRSRVERGHHAEPRDVQRGAAPLRTAGEARLPRLHRSATAAGHDEESRRLLTRIAQHNDVLFAFVHDPLEADLPDAGPLVFARRRAAARGGHGRQRGLRERFRRPIRRSSVPAGGSFSRSARRRCCR